MVSFRCGPVEIMLIGIPINSSTRSTYFLAPEGSLDISVSPAVLVDQPGISS